MGLRHGPRDTGVCCPFLEGSFSRRLGSWSSPVLRLVAAAVRASLCRACGALGLLLVSSAGPGSAPGSRAYERRQVRAPAVLIIVNEPESTGDDKIPRPLLLQEKRSLKTDKSPSPPKREDMTVKITARLLTTLVLLAGLLSSLYKAKPFHHPQRRRFGSLRCSDATVLHRFDCSNLRACSVRVQLVYAYTSNKHLDPLARYPPSVSTTSQLQTAPKKPPIAQRISRSRQPCATPSNSPPKPTTNNNARSASAQPFFAFASSPPKPSAM